MDLAFSDTRIQQLCSSVTKLRSRLGERGATTALAHLASLRAASCLEEFRHLPGRCRERRGQFVLVLPKGGGLIFESAEQPPPTDGVGSLDWTAIRSVRIIAIADPSTATQR